MVKIIKAGEYKIIKLKYIKNIEFLKCVVGDNLLEGQSFDSFFSKMKKIENSTQLIDEGNKQTVNINLRRCDALKKFSSGNTE